jgi:type IV secretory pathway VirB10-like protein
MHTGRKLVRRLARQGAITNMDPCRIVGKHQRRTSSDLDTSTGYGADRRRNPAPIYRRKLKVFQAQFGFYDTVVAATSQAAALRAWGTHQNLFTSGEARVATDATAVAAALEHPETPLRRAVGSGEPFSLEPTGLPKLPDSPNKQKPREKAKPEPPRRQAADRSKLDAAEAALRELNERRKQEEAEFRRAEEALEARRTAAQQLFVKARRQAEAEMLAAREDYDKAGGID